MQGWRGLRARDYRRRPTTAKRRYANPAMLRLKPIWPGVAQTVTLCWLHDTRNCAREPANIDVGKLDSGSAHTFARRRANEALQASGIRAF